MAWLPPGPPATEAGFGAEATDDPGVFTRERLDRCAAVVLLSTTGPVLTDQGRSALEAYVRRGGGLLAVHAAANAEPDWPFYRDLLGTRFAGHPPLQPGPVHMEDPAHPATSHLPAEWGTHGADHPLSWCHDKAGGRFFFTALGHTAKAYASHASPAHLAGALHWAAGRH
ncbi:ThuA domain-containing protein [Streptomyces sp. NPDC050844]|uniref:ThuA domain-containing protein n=1 Tax=Streptomyces sp. NPDC050844 TaxID=3155790 RepID=UPI0033D374AF